MGTIKHDAVIVTHFPDDKPGPQSPDVAAFRASMPEEFQRLLVGPIPTVVNGDITWFFAPDGSKEGWGPSDEGDEWRARFLALFSFTFEDGSSPFDLVAVRFGGDQKYDGGSIITTETGTGWIDA